jgi:hypothetical protein
MCLRVAYTLKISCYILKSNFILNYMQQIRQTVLTRAGGRSQSSGGQLDEAPESEESAEVGTLDFPPLRWWG